MDIAFVIVVTLAGVAAIGGLILLAVRVKGVKDLAAGQPDREAAFLATEMAASYDAARHVRDREA
ncbi:hypothetical protein [Stenotrophomonas sp.]|uniref:hypothetical protein n=1 Tax=Stenotrophomonas sp. TaxID=69392 RepID=UPI0028AE0A0F|nr:hypothetical protein [Stenotrophomonas sp.]